MNESFSSTNRDPDAASVNVTRPFSTLRRDTVSVSASNEDAGLRPVERAGSIEAKPDLRRQQAHFGGADFTAHQRSEADFELDGAGA